MKQILLLITFCLVIFTRLASAQNTEASDLIKRADTASAKEKVDIYNKIVWKFRNLNPQKGLEYSKKAIQLADSINYSYGLTMAYNLEGVLYRNMGFYNMALEDYQRALDLAKKYQIKDQQGYALNNFGNIYLYQELPDKAIEYLLQVIEIAKEINNEDMLAYAQQNIGRSFILKKDYDKAIEYLQKALDTRKKAGITKKIGVTYKYLADAYLGKKNFKKARQYYDSTKIYADFKYDLDLFSDYSCKMSELFLAEDNIDSAYYYADFGLNVAKQVGTKFRMMKAYQQLAKIEAANGNYEKAYEYELLALCYKDSLFNEQVGRKIRSIEFEKEQLKKKSEIALLKKDLEYKENINKRNNIILGGLIFVIIVIIVAFVSYLRHRKRIIKINNELVRRNKIIEQQNHELEAQKNELERQQKEVTDSILYAGRIQTALRPSNETFDKIFKEYFILDLPRDIVSGDFYWLKKCNDKILLAVADATGHGVPGAFMSVLGISLLNEVTGRYIDRPEMPETGKILNLLRENVKTTLRQGYDNRVKDGYDIALLKIDLKTREIEFSGANSNIFIVENKKLIMLKGDPMPVSFYFKENSFKTQKYKLGDSANIYLTSDGYKDQFGGDNSKKFSNTRFKKILVDICEQPFDYQRNELLRIHKQWVNGRGQLDDILVIGIKI